MIYFVLTPHGKCHATTDRALAEAWHRSWWNTDGTARVSVFS